jgi:hypothetical protein
MSAARRTKAFFRELVRMGKSMNRIIEMKMIGRLGSQSWNIPYKMLQKGSIP